MKLSYPVCASEIKEAIMAWCGDFEDGVEYIGKNGYQGVELLVKNPFEVNRQKIQEILKKNNMRISAIGTTPMQKEDHLFLLDENEKLREEAKRRLEGLIELAGWFGVPLLLGKYRGTVKDADFCRMKDLEEIIRKANRIAADRNIEIFVEPQNKDNINNLNTVKETVEWIQKNEYTNVRLLMDIFHMNKTEQNIVGTLERYHEYIGMIHMSDSERKVPGFGEVDISKILDALEKIKYKGYLSMEIEQIPDTKFAAALSSMSLQYMREVCGGRE